MDDTEDNPSSSDAVARFERQEKRQAMYKEQLQNSKINRSVNPGSARVQKNSIQGRAQSESKAPKKSNVGPTDYISFLTVALLLDTFSFLFNLIPIIGGVASDLLISLPGSLILYLMYSRKNIDIKSGKNMIKFFGTLALKFVPIVNALPEFTLNVLMMLGSEKIKEFL